MGTPWCAPTIKNFVLPRNRRLNLRKEFLNLKKHGKMINSESFGLLYIKNESGQAQGFVPTKIRVVGDDPRVIPSRLSFIVSTKISKKAVERNLIRRRLSEIVREIFLGTDQEVCPYKKISGVFLCKKTILNKNYQEVKKEVENVFNKIN